MTALKQKLALLALLLPVLTLQAQIQGTAYTADSPAAFATVALYADSNTNATPQAFAYTDGDGHFKLDAQPQNGQWLTVRYLGCKEWRHPLPTPASNITIRLETDAKTLNEVIVKSNYKTIEVRGDTISINTEYFKTGAEETASEVLQKIPGMEVSDNGQVKYGGKDIDKILVDGKDIFTQGSDAALNTLPADAMKGAEIIRNYHSGSLVDEFSSRELVAMNIKTDGRTRVNGVIGLLGGLTDKAKLDGSLLSIANKLSITATLAGNNTGEAVFSISDYIKNVIGLDDIISAAIGSGTAALPISADEMSMLIPRSNIYRSFNGFTNISGTWNHSEKLRVKGNVMLNGQDVDALSLSERKYLSLDQTQQHRSQNGNSNLFVSGNLQERWKPTKNIEISNLTHFSNTSLQTNDSIDESGATEMFASEDDQLRKQNIREELVANIKMGRNLLSAHLTMDNSHRNFSYGLMTDNVLLPAYLYDSTATGYSIMTNRSIGNTIVAPEVSYALKLSSMMTLTSTASFEHNANSFAYSHNEGANEKSVLDWEKLSAALQLAKTKGLFQFAIGATARRTAWRSNIGGLPDDHRNDILPQGSLHLVFSSAHRLTLSAQMERNPIEMEYLLRTPMVDGSSSLRAGSNIVNPFAKTASTNLHYQLYDQFSNTMFFVMGSISDNRFSARSHTLQDSSIATSTVYENDGYMQNRSLGAQLSKGLGRWPVDLKLAGSLTSSVSQTSLNGTDDEINSLSRSASIDFVSRRRGVFNFEVGASYSLSTSDYSTADIGSSLLNTDAHVVMTAAWTKFSAVVRFAFSHLENGNYNRDYYDLGFKFEYKLKHWRLSLRGGNVLNLKNIEWREIETTPLYIAQTTYRRMPGYVLLGAKYRF
ncbi:MAG: hypothetical protein IJ789_00260 [Bacteroidales bacterium]|nr:hypothetical protein [Bacteroidales bacterium]